MTLSLHNILYMLLGAGLTAVGVVFGTIAERIRTFRKRDIKPANVPQPSPRKRAAAPDVIDAEWSEAQPVHRAPRPGRGNVRVPVIRPEPPVANATAAEVVAALVASGFRKAVAIAATNACSPAEQKDESTWLRAALRRCAQGAPS